MVFDKEELQQLLNNKELYTQENFLDEVSKYMSHDEIKDNINRYAGQCFLSAYSFVESCCGVFSPDYQPFFQDKMYRSEYEKLSMHIVFNQDERNYLKDLLTKICTPTTYITPHGKVTINYDVNKKDQLIRNCEQTKASDWLDYLSDLLNIHERMIIIQHFL
ncbi:Hypothetical protein HVR_LOCUS870 [uncultured virus]|nr:Hypothetical protein HVR_LOCUS870 [uncultured virus]